jgi:sulfotransferase 6B1
MTSLKHSLKTIRWQARRAAAGLRWGKATLSATPAVLGNAMPKSGSHLINQVLHGLPEIGPFVNPGFPPVNRTEGNQRLPEGEILAAIQRMHPGDISYGYILAKEPFISALVKPGRATVFVYRDPRDMIISHIFYATQMYEGHWMHQYYTETLHTMEERIDAAIQGVQAPGSELTPVRQRYDGYMGWLEQLAVLSLRFEDLILDREVAFGRLLDYLEERGFTPSVSRRQAIAALQQAVMPKKSGTFRKGKPGNWREYFTDGNKAHFKETTGDLLISLGYEQDNNW